MMISAESVYQFMGYGDSLPDDTVCRLVEDVIVEAEHVAIPKHVYRIVEASVLDDYRIAMDGVAFRVGKTITSYLSGMTHACVFVATAGYEYENFMKRVTKEGNILKEFVADSVGSVIADMSVQKVSERLETESHLKYSLPYSPGYCAWNIMEQPKLFSLLPEKPCGVELNDSCLMYPVKSVSGFFALGRQIVRQPYRCDICDNTHCLIHNRHERNC